MTIDQYTSKIRADVEARRTKEAELKRQAEEESKIQIRHAQSLVAKSIKAKFDEELWPYMLIEWNDPYRLPHNEHHDILINLPDAISIRRKFYVFPSSEAILDINHKIKIAKAGLKPEIWCDFAEEYDSLEDAIVAAMDAYEANLRVS